MEFTNVPKKAPCPCGSGRKFKHCHGTEERQAGFTPVTRTNVPKLSPEFTKESGIDPNQIDPQMMMQFAQALQKLPKGQMQKLQSLIQKAMSGKDVSREAIELEKNLPPEFLNFIQGMQGAIPTNGEARSENESTAVATTPSNEERAKAQGKLRSIWNKITGR
jgi:hypothetical protein